MKPIRLYFAGEWLGTGINKAVLIKAGIKNILCSYAYPKKLANWIANLSADAEGNIMIDSGAFSAWNKGKQIDFNAYVQYAHKAIEKVSRFKNQNIHIVNLDVIPGVAGQTSSLNKIHKQENRDLREASALAGYKNMRRMLKQGIEPIHVFHQGEDFKWIDKMVEYVSYIGISPANDLPSAARNHWISDVFEYLYKKNINVDTHGFAVTNYAVLRDFPWTSCDAASWLIGAAMGMITYPQGGFSNPDYSVHPVVLNVSARTIGKGAKHMQSHFLQQLENDGYSYDTLQTWQGRALLNIRYILGLEKWLNVYKRKVEYKPRTTLDFGN